MYSVHKPAPKQSSKKHRLIWLVAVAVVVALLAFGGYKLYQHYHPPVKAPVTPEVIPNETNSDNGSGYTPDKGSGSDTGGKDQNGGDTTPANVLVPSGNFVSNHKPSLSNPQRNTIQSSCTTTPGATCDIVFTKDGVSKTLGAQTVNGDGSAFWTWKPQDKGISEGTWTIEARANLGGTTKTAADAISLEVSP